MQKGGLYIFTFMIVQVGHINITGIIHTKELVIISCLWRETGMGDMLFIVHSTFFLYYLILFEKTKKYLKKFKLVNKTRLN